MNKKITREKDAKINGHICGTVCCMDGWLPDTFPHLFEWSESDCFSDTKAFSVPIGSCLHTIKFSPIAEIKKDLWAALTAANFFSESFGITLISNPDEVKTVWEKAIKDIRSGKLDEYLNFS